ncbi:MAG TPA: hypothetical protein VK978_00525 [Candidatus Saccharimonadales bacterium]|nr:hypothetical protein [Candidatus Saccharimonadales bacterium]
MTNTPTAARKSFSPFNMLSRELGSRGYSIAFLPLSPKYIVVTAPNGWQWVSRWAALSYPFVTVAAKQISINKTLAYQFADHYGVSIPKTLYLPEDADKAEAFVEQFAPVIVKPAAASGSHGLTLNITDYDALSSAITEARQYSQRVIVQQQFIGSEVRITVAEGEAVSIILRQPARVVGDGTSTVAQLIAAENEARKDLQFEQIPYPQLTDAIIAPELMTSQYIPATGEVVELSKNSLTSGGASLYEITDDIHPSYVEIALKLARALNPEFMVVDLMIQDYAVPQTDDNYTFIEFNTAPSLRLYCGMRTGKMFDMPAKIVDMLDKRSLRQ